MTKAFDLTPLTGKEVSSKRTLNIKGRDIDQKTLFVILLSLIPALFLALVTSPLLGWYGIVFIPICCGLGYLFVLGKNSRTGTAKWHATYDSVKTMSKDKKFLLSTSADVVDPSMCTLLYFVPASIQNPSIDTSNYPQKMLA
jgi:hypothetical protein